MTDYLKEAYDLLTNADLPVPIATSRALAAVIQHLRATTPAATGREDTPAPRVSVTADAGRKQAELRELAEANRKPKLRWRRSVAHAMFALSRGDTESTWALLATALDDEPAEEKPPDVFAPIRCALVAIASDEPGVRYFAPCCTRYVMEAEDGAEVSDEPYRTHATWAEDALDRIGGRDLSQDAQRQAAEEILREQFRSARRDSFDRGRSSAARELAERDERIRVLGQRLKLAEGVCKAVQEDAEKNEPSRMVNARLALWVNRPGHGGEGEGTT